MDRKSVVITDLDNTLFDWVEIWHRPFVAMLDAVKSLSGFAEETLLRDFKSVFSRHGTTEYAFVIQELPCLIERYRGEDLTEVFAPAIEAHRAARRQVMRLYPTVRETLHQLKKAGCLLIGYTESTAFYTHYRMRKLDLDLLLDFVYSPPDHDMPDGLNVDALRTKEAREYRCRRTTHRYTPRHEYKPSPQILAQIVEHTGADFPDCVYIGDSLMKDIAMAQQAGVADVWARYGAATYRPEYDLLRAVTHWSAGDVEKEKHVTSEALTPTHVLDTYFAQLLEMFTFEKYAVRHRGLATP